MSDASIRAATVADAPAIAIVHVAAWQAAYEGQLPAEFLASLSVADRTAVWSQALRSGEIVLVADSEDGVTGFVSVGKSRDDDAVAGTAELNAIYLDPTRWSKGIGHQLHEAAIARLADDGYDAVTLWVLGGNTRAIGFYERHGWAADGATKVDDRGEVAFHERRFRRPV